VKEFGVVRLFLAIQRD